MISKKRVRLIPTSFVLLALCACGESSPRSDGSVDSSTDGQSCAVKCTEAEACDTPTNDCQIATCEASCCGVIWTLILALELPWSVRRLVARAGVSVAALLPTAHEILGARRCRGPGVDSARRTSDGSVGKDGSVGNEHRTTGIAVPLIVLLVIGGCRGRRAEEVPTPPVTPASARAPAPHVSTPPPDEPARPRVPCDEDLADLRKRRVAIEGETGIAIAYLDGFHSCRGAMEGRDVPVRNREAPFDTPPYIALERWDALRALVLACFSCRASGLPACHEAEAELDRMVAEVRATVPPPKP